MDANIVAAIFGASASLAGVIAGIGGQWWLNRRHHKLEIAKCKTSLLTEISVILYLLETRDYVNRLKKCISDEEYPTIDSLDYFIANNEKIPIFIVEIPENYNLIFRTNVDKIGLMPSHSTEIIKFYSLLDAIIQDVKPDSIHNTKIGMTQEVLIHDLKVLSEAITTGNNIIKEDNSNKKFF